VDCTKSGSLETISAALACGESVTPKKQAERRVALHGGKEKKKKFNYKHDCKLSDGAYEAVILPSESRSLLLHQVYAATF
jgi:hypothetical protein